MKNQVNKKGPFANHQEHMDLQSFSSLLAQRKNLILICVIITVITVMVVSLISPKRYQATAKILAEPQKEINPYLIEKRSLQERKMFLETQKEIAVSNSVLRQTVAALKGKPEAQVTQKDIDKFLNSVKILSRHGMRRTVFGGNGIGESGIFFVTVVARKPDTAAEATNTLVKNYLKAVVRLRVDQAKAATAIFEGTVTTTAQGARDALDRLVEFETKAGSLLPELVNIDKSSIRVFSELVNLREDFESQRSEVARKRALIDALDAAMKDKGQPVIPTDLLIVNPTITVFKKNLAELNLKLNQMKSYYTDESREISSTTEEIQKAEISLKEEMGRTLSGERKSLMALEKSQEQLKITLDEYDEKMRQLSLMKSPYSGLKLEYSGWSKALEIQIQKLAEARIAAAERSSAQAANILVIDWAVADLDPVSPRLFRNFFIAILLGLGIGILLVLFEQMTQPAALPSPPVVKDTKESKEPKKE